MVLHLEPEVARLAPAVLLDVAGLVLADRHGRVRQVRDPEGDRLQLAADRVEALLALLQLVAEPGDLGLDPLDLLFERRRLVATLRLPEPPHQSADLLRPGVAQGLQLLRARLDLLALGLQRGQRGGIQLVAAGLGQASGKVVVLLAQQGGVGHGRHLVEAVAGIIARDAPGPPYPRCGQQRREYAKWVRDHFAIAHARPGRDTPPPQSPATRTGCAVVDRARGRAGDRRLCTAVVQRPGRPRLLPQRRRPADRFATDLPATAGARFR